MSYYRGDYYRGDAGNYYRGDPFLGALGALAGSALGKLGGKAAKWVAGRVGGSSARKATGVATVSGGGLPPILTDIAIPALGGAIAGGGITAVARMVKGGGEKKYRRMNPLNPRALKRALRRAEGFEKFARRTVNALRSGPKKFKTQTKKRG